MNAVTLSDSVTLYRAKLPTSVVESLWKDTLLTSDNEALTLPLCSADRVPRSYLCVDQICGSPMRQLSGIVEMGSQAVLTCFASSSVMFDTSDSILVISPSLPLSLSFPHISLRPVPSASEKIFFFRSLKKLL